MKLFQFALDLYQMMGIVPLHPNRNCSFNLNTICILLLISLLCIFSALFATFEAKSIQELGDSMCMTFGELGVCLIFLLTIWKMSHILILIREFEEIIEKSKTHFDFWSERNKKLPHSLYQM